MGNIRRYSCPGRGIWYKQVQIRGQGSGFIAEDSDGFSNLNDNYTPKDGEKFILVPESFNKT